MVNFNSNELGMVCDHLGHSLKIHTTVYRAQQNIIERSKVARILTLLESGSVDEIKVREKTSIIISISSYCSYEGMRVAQ